MSAVVRVNRTVTGVTVLGAGVRIGVWVQGCALACPGCASVDTWAYDGGRSVETADLADTIIEAVHTHGLTGLTLTGGEPVDQAEALAVVLDRVRAHPACADLDVLLFTGYPLAAARRRGAALLDRVDTVIAGRYRRDLPSLVPLVASSNQEVHHLTARGKRRYAQAASGTGPTIQLLASGGDLVMVGLPRPGDLDRLRSGLAERGVHLEGTSWTP